MPDNRCCFIDTNIWLYAFIQTGEVAKTAYARGLIQSEKKIVVSSQVVNEVCVNMTKKTGSTENDIRQIISSFFSKYSVVDQDIELLIQASRLREKHSFSYWDSLIVSAAQAAKADVLYTEDMQHGMVVNGVLRVTNPFIGA